MVYLGANDTRVTLVDDRGHEIYNTDFRNFPNVLTHLRPLIGAICIANPSGEVDKNLLQIFADQMKKEKNFHSLTALANAQTPSPTRPPAKTSSKSLTSKSASPLQSKKK